jgi:hypothetical protein
MICHHTKLHASLFSITLITTIKLKATTNGHIFVMLFYTSQNTAIVKVHFFQKIIYHIAFQDRTFDDANIARN